MALQMIIGKSGSGKSHFVYEKIIKESIKNPKKNYYIIVPEQYTMQVQKKVMSMHPNHGTMNIDVLSFHRLAHRVFDEVQEKQKNILEDVGKSMVLRKVAEEKKDQLTIFKRSLNKSGFIEELKSLLSEFYQYRVGKETLETLIHELENGTTLRGKLMDMRVIFEGFDKYLKDYTVAEQVLEVLSLRVNESKLLQDSVICLDGFTGFTPIQFVLLERLLHQVEWLLVTIPMDPKELDTFGSERWKIEDYELFALSKKTVEKLYEIAQKEEVLVAKPFCIEGTPYRFLEKKDLQVLEKGFFRYPIQRHLGEVENIALTCCQNPREEATYVVRKIRKLVVSGQCRFRDIGIVTGSNEIYEQELREAMERLHVPYFMDQNRSILNNPCMESIRSVLAMIREDFRYESVFRYLKAGMSGLSGEEVEKLENYVIACGIRGYRWFQKPFVRKLRGMDDDELLELNKIREYFLEEIKEFWESLQKKDMTVKEVIIALCFFMERLHYQRKLKQYELYFEKEGDLASAKTYQQIYGNICEILNKMATILGNEVMELEEFIAILDAGLSETKVGVIPPGLDQVLVGDMERSRFPDLKVMFIMGLNDGLIPKNDMSGGILNDREREILMEKKLELAPTAKQNAMMESFYIYLNFTKPSEKLYLSYAKVDTNGKTIHPSYLIGRLKKHFPNLVQKEVGEKEEAVLFTKEDSVEYVIQGFHEFLEGKENILWKELYCQMKEGAKGKEILHKIWTGAFYENEESPLSKAVSKAIYGEHLSGSVTRLEQYAACAFAHFLKYGLKVKEREEYKIRSMDLGNVFHKTLELFSKELDTRADTFRTIDDVERDQLVEQCVNSAVLEYQGDLFYSSKRNQYMITRMTRIAKRTIWALQEHIKRGRFEPTDYELSFQNYKDLQSAGIQLEEGSSLNLQGKIDRIDTYEDEENLYVKIIDYKSGSTEFDVIDLYYGLQIQLVVYMNAALEVLEKRTNKKVIPAGIFYYNMKDPFIEREEEEAEIAILKKLKMNGLANGEEGIIEKLEEETKEGYLTMPISRLKSGAYSKASKVVTTKQLRSVGHYVTERMKKMGSEMIKGNIEIAPYKLGERSACDYCEFHGICGFDTKLGNTYRHLSKGSREEFLKEMEGEEE